jgi:Flp pilus assembly protein TadD
MADRALELDPDDPAVHAFMAELAIVEGNGTDAVAHLRRALDTGLTANDARELLDAALERLPQSEELKAMRHELNEPPEASGDDALPDVPLRPATGA